MKVVGLFVGLTPLLAVAAAVPWAMRRRDEAPLGLRSACEAYAGRPAGWLASPTAGMVAIEGGTFVPGSTQGYPEERPGAAERVGDFFIDRTEVTNAEFEDFVRATGYVTVAEEAGSAPVFHVPTEAELSEREYPWWSLVRGASWRHPDGPESGAPPNHPVVQVAFDDAVAYAHWLGRELPSEAEWELAARAGRDDESLHRAPRGAKGEPAANFWQGEFPVANTAEDGFVSRAPVGCYPANPFQLHDMVGNVWEWTADVYSSPRATPGEDAPSSPGSGRVIKGGSFLCASNFCARYRVSARHRQEPATPTAHIGFRTVLRKSTGPAKAAPGLPASRGTPSAEEGAAGCDPARAIRGAEERRPIDSPAAASDAGERAPRR